MFRRKLLAVFALTVFLSVAAVALLVSAVTRRAFDRSEDERTTALVTQFRREFNRQGEEVSRRVEAIAASEAASRMAVALNRAPADPGPYFELAKATAENNQLDFLEFVESDGTIISSAQSPAKFGYPESDFGSFAAAADQAAFLKQEELQDGTELGLFAVRARQGEKPVYVIGGRRLDKISSLSWTCPRACGYCCTRIVANIFRQIAGRSCRRSPTENVLQSNCSPDRCGAAIQRGEDAVVHWSHDPADDEVFHAIPLLGRGDGRNDRPLLAILLVGNSRRTYVGLMRHIRSAALLVGGGGIVLAVLVSSWAAARVTRPVEQLAHAAQEVAAGNWYVRVDVIGRGRTGAAGRFFQSHDHGVAGAKRAAGASRARGGMARTGSSAGARIEESAVSFAADGGKSGAGAAAESGAVRRSVSREFKNAAGGDFEPERNYRQVQRIFEDAAAAVADSAGQ